jgi:hypothetical protein
VEFPRHGDAIAILSKAESELVALGYGVEFVKSFSKEECLPAYSNARIVLKLTAGMLEPESLGAKPE